MSLWHERINFLVETRLVEFSSVLWMIWIWYRGFFFVGYSTQFRTTRVQSSEKSSEFFRTLNTQLKNMNPLYLMSSQDLNRGWDNSICSATWPRDRHPPRCRVLPAYCQSISIKCRDPYVWDRHDAQLIWHSHQHHCSFRQPRRAFL